MLNAFQRTPVLALCVEWLTMRIAFEWLSKASLADKSKVWWLGGVQ